ncbi:transposable element Tcb2 transposase [Trichonephila clavipes]|nr:transposable element Tcb2 transposase [Trichonephila clavipes]
MTRWLTVIPSEIYKLWQQFPATDLASKGFIQARSCTTTSANDRYLSLWRNTTAPPAELRSIFVASSRRLVSRSTVRQRLLERDLYAIRTAIGNPFTSRHRLDRFQWACQYVHWTYGQCRAVLFTDEFRFRFVSDMWRIFIWREHGTHFHP